MDLYDHYFSRNGLNLENYKFKSYENDQKLKVLIKLNPKYPLIETEKEKMNELINRKFVSWISKYYEKIKQNSFSFYSTNEIEIHYLQEGFTRLNYLRNANSFLERRSIYCLDYQQKLNEEKSVEI